MQNELTSYRDRVFDEEVLTFCLTFMELTEKIPANSAILKRVVLDSLTVNSSLAEVIIFLKSLNTLPIQEFNFHLTEFLDSVDVMGDRKAILSEYLMTIRHLAAVPTFKNWQGLFAIVKVFGADDKILTDLLMTVRHLAALPEFTEWEAFFTAMKVLGGRESSVVVGFMRSVRHSVGYFQQPDSLRSIFRTLSTVPQYVDACAYGQLDSKRWLIEEAQKIWGYEWGTVFVLAGWIGLLPRFVFDAGIGVKAVRSFDMDPSSGPAAELLNQSSVQKDWLFKSSTLDVTQLTYPATFSVQRKDGSLCELHESPDMVINTSCEHFADIEAWWGPIPFGTRVILQSNDGFHIPEHVRCFKSLTDFEAAMNLSRVDYRGEKPLADFNRFMLIGIK